MRTRQAPVNAHTKQKSYALNDSCAVEDEGVLDKENVDVNIQPRTRGRKGLAAVATTKRKQVPALSQPAQGKEVESRTAKRRKKAVTTQETRTEITQGTPHNSAASTQETPPTFAFTQGKKTFRKRKLLKKTQKSQECDQKRIEDLVQYFKGLDDQQLKFV